MSGLRLVASVPDFFAHGGDAAVRYGEGFGCHCGRCGRDVSAPFGFEGRLVWCLYCGMEAGHVPLVESPWPSRYTFGVTLDECREDKDALARGGAAELERVQEARARKLGRVWDLF